MTLDVLNNPTVSAILTIFLIVYASRVNLPLPPYVRNLFKNEIFRVLFLSLLIVFRFDKAPSMALMIAIIFVLTLQMINNQEIKENFAYIEAYRNIKRNEQAQQAHY
jgi:hypothetical protein